MYDLLLYFHTNKKLIIGIYVDDILLIGDSLDDISVWKGTLSDRFALTDIGLC